MPQEPDKRRRTDLDLFVLALIDGGVSTPYELQKAAGISQGASIPALQRLLQSRLVRQGKPGARGRADYEVTVAGKKLLKTGWRPMIPAGPSGEIDSDLRVALLALWGGGNGRVAAAFLRESGDKMLARAAAQTTGDSESVTPLARWYAQMRTIATKAVDDAERSAIRAMADALPSLSGKPRSRRSTGKPRTRRSGTSTQTNP